MSFSSLSIGASGLYAAQRAVEVAAHNVANANNEGFTRQRVTIQSSLPTPGTAGMRGSGDLGTGVAVLDISRLRDRLADVSYRGEATITGAADARAETLSRADSLLGTFGDGAPEDLSSFLAAWNQLSLTPTDSSARASVLAAGQRLADSIRSAADQLTTVGHEVALRVTDDVAEVNGLLSSVAKLNDQIIEAGISNRSPNDLLDQRDAALDRLARLTGAKIDPQADGSVTVSIGAVTLVQGKNAQSLAASATEPVTVSVNGTTTAFGGEIGAYVATVGVDLPAYRTQLDALAVGLRDVVNAAHAAGTGADGSTGLAFFTGTDAMTINVDPSLTEAGVAASASGAAADGNNALAIAAALRTGTAVGAQPFGDALRTFGGRVAQASTDAQRNARTAEASLSSAQAARASLNGVSVDEEMVDLVKFQHSYEAAARVVSVADGMLDKLIEMVR